MTHAPLLEEGFVQPRGGDRHQRAVSSALRCMAPLTPSDWALVAGGDPPPPAALEVGGLPTCCEVVVLSDDDRGTMVSVHAFVPGCASWAEVAVLVGPAGCKPVLAGRALQAVRDACDPTPGRDPCADRAGLIAVSGGTVPCCLATRASVAACAAANSRAGDAAVAWLLVTRHEAEAAAGGRSVTPSSTAFSVLSPHVRQPVLVGAPGGYVPTGEVLAGPAGAATLLSPWPRVAHRTLAVSVGAVSSHGDDVAAAFVFACHLSSARTRGRGPAPPRPDSWTGGTGRSAPKASGLVRRV